MDAEEYDRIAAAEASHWWYLATRAFVLDQLEPLATGASVLDLGCGTGGNGAALAPRAAVIGLDRSPRALAHLAEHHRAMPALQGDGAALPFADRSFDAVLAITVLYTVPDDGAVIDEIARVLRPGGTLVVLEPAGRHLARGHDRVVHGRRRYGRGELETAVATSGLEVLRSTHLHAALVAPAAVLAAVDRLRPPAPGEATSDLRRPALDRALGAVARAERRWLARHDLPIGTSVAVRARRPLSGGRTAGPGSLVGAGADDGSPRG
ncbi:MAG: class I SAM-dependent methyltransferase [Acidimicrobiales bacterium]